MVQSHQEPIESLRSEGEELKTQGGPDDMKRVDHWVEDLAQRWDELAGTADDRQVPDRNSSSLNVIIHIS